MFSGTTFFHFFINLLENHKFYRLFLMHCFSSSNFNSSEMRFQRGKIWFLELLTRLHTFPLRRAKSSGSLTGTMQPKVDGDTIESPESVNKRSLISVVQYWTFLFSNNFSFHFMKIFLNTLSSHAQKIARKNFFFDIFFKKQPFH